MLMDPVSETSTSGAAEVTAIELKDGGRDGMHEK